jgi:uncharacterized protein YqeY
MNLTEQINADLKTAMKNKDQAGLRGIRAIKAAILLANTDGSGKALDEKSSIRLLQKLVKQRQDSLDIYQQQGREDLAKIEREEIEVIKRYLPEQLDEAEIIKKIKAIIDETGASSMKDMGRIMGMANAKMAGKADGKTIAAIVKKLLTQ